jgi:hypothetical protein
MRTTVAQVKASRIPQILNLCSDDTERLCSYLNEAVQRLLVKGRWWGTYQRIRCVVDDDDCVTWPREVAAPDLVSLCSTPLQIRSQWFEFGEFGYGPRDDGNKGGMQCFDRGIACTYSDMDSDGVEKIRVYADVTESAGSVVTLQGYDENNNWIRTQVDGEWIDGEQVSLVSGPNITTNYFSSLVAVQKPQTNGNVRLYARNVTEATQRPIAVYQPDELLPQYRRSYIPGLKDCDCEDACEQKVITAMVKLEFVPVSKDADWLLIGNIPALKFMCNGIRLGESNDTAGMAAQEALAIRELNKELAHYTGGGTSPAIRVINASNLGGPIPNLL